MPSPTNSSTEQNTPDNPEHTGQENPQDQKSELDKLQEQLKVTQESYSKDVAKLQEQNNKLINDFNSYLQQQQSRPAPEPSKPKLSKDDVIRSIQEENDFSKIFDFVDQEVGNVKSQYDSQLQTIQKNGLQSISALALQQARSNPDMPYFKEVEGDIDQMLKQFGSSPTPENIQAAYNQVRGQRFHDFIAWEEEKKKRKEADALNTQTMGANQGQGSRGTFDASKEDDPNNFFPQDTINFLQSRKGVPIESYVKKMKYKDVKEVADKSKSVNASMDDWLNYDLVGAKKDND